MIADSKFKTVLKGKQGNTHYFLPLQLAGGRHSNYFRQPQVAGSHHSWYDGLPLQVGYQYSWRAVCCRKWQVFYHIAG